MTAPPLLKPPHLAPAEATSRTAWLRARALSLAAFGLGLVSFMIVSMSQHELWATPDWRISLPGFVVTAVVAGLALARRAKGWPFWLCGLGLAGAAVVLGWFLMISIIVGVTLIVMLILHAVM
ncbi:MAG: hypothetical protein NT062_31545 [Proteobacteria bacterium]|nr:hypothetical protein [Pseudomonadota bacterium]